MIPEVTDVATIVQQQQQLLQVGVATRAGFDGLSNCEGIRIMPKINPDAPGRSSV